MQNLSENEIKQIMKMQNLSRNELEQIANKRGIKKYKNMSKEVLLISLLKSQQSITELRKSKSNSIKIEEIKKFNVLRNNFSREKIKEIRKKNYKKEKIDEWFTKQETEQEERDKKQEE